MSYYRDPTAETAIGNVMREMKEQKHHPDRKRTEAYRKDEEGESVALPFYVIGKGDEKDGIDI